MLIRCCTLFDITETGITGHFRSSNIPFVDQAGHQITDQTTWNRARNQQRNFETISQILQLRTQIFDVTHPVKENSRWSFNFEIESDGVYRLGSDMFGTLKHDCEAVPMIVGLDEEYASATMLTVDGSQQNIWFEEITVNN